MAVTLLQSATTASAAASPTSITPSLSSASTKGNLLLLAVTVTGTTPTITTPSGWSLLSDGSTTGLAFKLFAQLNNAGGVSAVAITVGGTGGGACAAIFEYSGVGNQGLDGIAVASSASASSYATPAYPSTTFIEDLIFNAVGFAAATLTPSNSAEWSTVVGAVVSTNGTPNAQLACFWGLSQSTRQKPTIGGGFSAAVADGAIVAAFNVAGSFAPNLTVVSGNAGYVVGGNYQGSIGA